MADPSGACGWKVSTMYQQMDHGSWIDESVYWTITGVEMVRRNGRWQNLTHENPAACPLWCHACQGKTNASTWMTLEVSE